MFDRFGTNSIKWEFMEILDREADTGDYPHVGRRYGFPCCRPIMKRCTGASNRRFLVISTHRTPAVFRAVCGLVSASVFNWYVNSEDIVYSPGVVPAIAY